MEGDEELLLSSLFTAKAASVGAADTVNYYVSAPKYPAYHNYAKMSSSKNTSIKDGIHKDSQGRARAYKGGKYFIDGSFSLNGKTYYADTDGYLLSGWARMRVNSVAKERGHTAYRFYYFDPDNYTRSKGLRTIDGIPHYFDDTAGYMLYNVGVDIDGKLYYADRYGICDRPKLRYGNVVQTDEESGPDASNSAYLAVNNTTAVDIATFAGQDGEYSFRPRMLANTTVEPFGFTPINLSNGFYCKLYDESLKGRIGCCYRNVGRYKGREVDMRLTVTDYTFFELDGYKEMGYFYVVNDRIGINATNLRDITANMQFYDHETQQPLTLKGFATLSDIDISQSVTILSDVTDVYVDKNSVLYREPGTLTFTAPFNVAKHGSYANDDDLEYAMQVNYNSDHLTFRFGAAYHDYVFSGSNLPINGESRQVWAYDYTGNDNDYAIVNDQGTLWQSWQGLYYKRFGRVSLPPVTKTVSDSDETDVTDNRLKNREEAFTYSLHNTVPGEIEQFYYSSYQITDTIHQDLLIDESTLKVVDDGGTDVSGWFTANIAGQKITISAKPDVLTDDAFYDRGYNFKIGVRIRPERNLGTGSEYTVENSCTVSIDRSTGPEKSDSNKVVTHVPLSIPVGEIRITKRIRADEIVWANGNPTFLFRAEGKDQSGKLHRYEDFLCFRKGSYTTDGEGYAVLSTVIKNVPAGSYDVKELRVVDYYLTGASADTSNMTIHTVGSPGRDKDPSQVFYGTAQLSEKNLRPASPLPTKKATITAAGIRMS